jgi:large subunit ribosomal protein L23
MAEEKKEKKTRATKKIGEKLTKKAEASAPSANVSDYGVLLSPMITEKSSMVGGSGSRVVFRVDRRATKTEIKSAVERAFKVTVENVNTINYLGKPKRTSTSEGRRTAYKKAYVTLQAGQTINVIEGL